jgi:hypothetical protein
VCVFISALINKFNYSKNIDVLIDWYMLLTRLYSMFGHVKLST